jgi:hypothetical protein
MKPSRISYLHLGMVGACVALASACSHAVDTRFSGEDDDGGGATALTGSSGGASNGSPGGGSGGVASNGGSGGSGNGSSGTVPPAGTSSAGTDAGTVMAPATGSNGDAGPTATCSATMVSGAIALSTNFLEPNVLGDGGYAYSYSDTAKGGASSVCLDPLALCGAGSTGAMSALTWGAGIGVNLNQAMGTSPPVGMFAATGSGISYTLSNLPSQGASLIVDNGGMDYCAQLSATSATVKWSDFNLTCWAPTPAGALSGPPSTATHVNFQVDAAAAVATFDFCVTAVTFAK